MSCPPRPLRLLLVGDSAADADLLLSVLRHGGYAPDWMRVDSPDSLRAALESVRWDIVLADHLPPDFGVLDALALVRREDDPSPLIVVSRTVQPDLAVAVLRAGADDYLHLDDLLRLAPAVERAVREAGERRARRRAEEALVRSERLYHALIEHSFDGVVLLDAEGRVRYRSPSMRGILGYEGQEIFGVSATSLVHPADLPAALATLADLVARPGGDARAVYRLRHRDGGYRWVEVLGANLLAEAGVEALVLNIRDITERRQADELRQRLAAIVETSADAIFSVSLEGVIESWNDGAARLFGYSREEAVGASFDLLAGPDRHHEQRRMLAEMRAGAEPVVDHETMCRHRDGHAIDVAVTYAPLRDAADQITALSIVVRDITARKRAEREEQRARAATDELAQLRAEREREARIVAEVGAALAHELDPERLYRLTLEHATRVLPGDYAHMRLYQDGWAVVAAASGDTSVSAGTRLFPLTDEAGHWLPIARDTVVRIDDSTEIPYWVEVQPYVGERRAGSTLIVPIVIDGEAIGSLAISSQRTHTYTDHHVLLATALGDHLTLALRNARLYAREQERARAAEELVRVRNDFVAAVSHELRTPLTGVVGYTELLLMQWDTADDATRRDRVARIAASAGRQQRLIDDLLLASQADAGQLELSRTALPLASLARQAAEEVVASYAGQRIDLEGSEHLMVQADPARALQVLVNLLDNAAKYSPEGSPVAVSWRAEAAAVVIRVRDRGSGVPEEGREQLFTRFGRLRGSRMRAGRVGTGLGLYLGRELARAMDGELDLEATGPDGSTFRLRLPLASQET